LVAARTPRRPTKGRHSRAHTMHDHIQLLREYCKYHDAGPGSIVAARVVAISRSHVVLRAGLKSDSHVPLGEFVSPHGDRLEVKVGDVTLAYVERDAGDEGTVRLSREKARRRVAWGILDSAHRTRGTIMGTVVGRVKGGMTAVVNGMRAFLPGSLIDTRPVKDAERYEGRRLRFHVIKLDRKRGNVVLSRRSVIERRQAENRNRLLASLGDGDVVQGVIKNLTDYGAFIDLGGLDGLLHITDISWRRIRHPSQVLSVGDRITVKVLKFDRTKTRVSLGLKQLHPDPWAGIIGRYPAGSRVRGRVTNIADYGLFVEIERGIEGLLHVSEMHQKSKGTISLRHFRVGQYVNVTVLDVSKTRRRISLGMKHGTLNPWLTFYKGFRKNDRMGAIIRSPVDVGILVDLPMGVHGVVCMSRDLRRRLLRALCSGGVVEARVVGVDVNRGRISLASGFALGPLGVRMLAPGASIRPGAFVRMAPPMRPCCLHVRCTHVAAAKAQCALRGAHVAIRLLSAITLRPRSVACAIRTAMRANHGLVPCLP
jgi:small subunit ribosomal protein S1